MFAFKREGGPVMNHRKAPNILYNAMNWSNLASLHLT